MRRRRSPDDDQTSIQSEFQPRPVDADKNPVVQTRVGDAFYADVYVNDLRDEVTNVEQPLDATGDGAVSPDDVLTIFNELNARGAGRIDERMTLLRGLAAHAEGMQWVSTTRLDTNGDGYLSPIDALLIVNYLNSPAPHVNLQNEMSAHASVGPIASKFVGPASPSADVRLPAEGESTSDWAAALTAGKIALAPATVDRFFTDLA